MVRLGCLGQDEVSCVAQDDAINPVRMTFSVSGLFFHLIYESAKFIFLNTYLGLNLFF